MYEGAYGDGVKHGFGEYFWAKDNAVYKGDWNKNTITGYGVYQWGDGRIYTGYWDCNNMDNIGILRYPEGKVYEGKFESDKKHGYGFY